MKNPIRISTLRRNQSGPSGGQGPSQPPRKRVTQRLESTIMFTYSAIEKSPKRMPLYSVWYPATSSVSASGRSKGGRFVSAVPAARKTTKPTNCGMTYQIVCCCSSMICVRESEPAISTTPSTDSASATSYDTICAHVRIEPSSAYFESEAQPPTMNPYTPSAPSAKIRISEIGTSAISPEMSYTAMCQRSHQGMTAKARSAVKVEMIGAVM